MRWHLNLNISVSVIDFGVASSKEGEREGVSGWVLEPPKVAKEKSCCTAFKGS